MGTTSYTYTTLAAAIQAWTEDSGAEIVANIAQIISRGESRLYADLNLEITDRVRTGVLTVDVNEQDIKPATWQGTRSLHLTPVGGGARSFLLQRTYDYCVDYEPTVANTDMPLYFCELSETEFFMSPAPDVAYPYVLREVATPDALVSGSNESTWLSTTQGDLLLDACMIEAEMFAESDQFDVSKWAESYQSKLPARRSIARAAVRADYAPVQNAARTVEPKP